MITRIILPRPMLKAFRDEAVCKFPVEYMETLWGRIEGGTVIVSALGKMPQEASEDALRFDRADTVNRAGQGEILLGSLHTHCNMYDPSPSPQDWEDAFKFGEHIFGIMTIWKEDGKPGKFKTAVSWWEPQPSILMIHPRESGKKARKPRKKSEEIVQPSPDSAPLVNLTNIVENT